MTDGFTKIGVVGAGSMGSGLVMLFAENGLAVSLYDANGAAIDALPDILNNPQSGLDPALHPKLTGYKDLTEFMSSLAADAAKLLVLSIPHGSATDTVLSQICTHLRAGDVILDGGNEWYQAAARRQAALRADGIAYLSMGVSGGYQAARPGPSISASGDAAALARVLPLLERIAARDARTGRACAAALGPGACGHYVKMVHNGIEQGVLGVVCETWAILHRCLGIDLDEVAEIFEGWVKEGELKRNFLFGIGADICRRHKENGAPGHIVDEVQDKVVQDADNSEDECTGFWTVMEAASRHVCAPTISSAHFFRIGSSDRAERMKVASVVGDEIGAVRKEHVEEKDKKAFAEDVRLAAYCGCLASYAQGMNLIARASRDEGWGVRPGKCVEIWREGCIIRSEHIADVLQPVYEKEPEISNTLTLRAVGDEIQRTVGSLERVVRRGLGWNAHIPTLSASLEYFKYCGGKELASGFMEAELDYFGSHKYDEKKGSVCKGKHHYDWRPA
ncbi:6-phosphogluconate dehydrogenase decarboxylating [Trametes maxima]|nr:6-phosphogluconate dehydrogenase decarboxylating [Trametes maxima]